MPTIIDLQALGDSPGTVEVVANALLEGDLVGLPLETSYAIAMLPDWRGRRGQHHLTRFPSESAALAFRDVASIHDLLRGLPDRPMRLLRRCWPGSLVVELSGLLLDPRLQVLPEEIRRRLFRDEGLRVAVPRQQFVRELLRHLPGPLLVSLPARESDRWRTASDANQALGSQIEMLVDDGPVRYDQRSTVVRIDGSDVTVVEEGVLSAKAIERMAGEMILFVCTGNTCRSPMAESLMRRKLAQKLACAEDDLLDHGFSVLSAGLAAQRGSPASPEAVDLLEEQGIDLRGHESQMLTKALVEQADRIVTMTRSHREAIVSSMPELAHKVRVLCASGRDIADPIGGGVDEYRECLTQISDNLDTLVEEILGEGEEEGARDS
jgi:L-threonylcarbamoyladenylate synthase